MNLVGYAFRANTFIRNSFIRNYESLISMVRSSHTITRFILGFPTFMPEFLRHLPGNLQNYLPTEALKTIIENKVVPYETFLGKFKDYLTFVEVTDRTAKFYDELQKGRLSARLVGTGTQVVQKVVETALLGDKWNLWTLARFSFLNIGQLKIFKDVCVIIASAAGVKAYQADKVIEEDKAGRENVKLNSFLANLNSLGLRYAGKALTTILGRVTALETRVTNKRGQLAAAIAAGGLNQSQLQKKLERINEKLKKATEILIAKFFIREDHNGIAIVPPANFPAPLQAKITLINLNHPVADRQNLLFRFQRQTSEVKFRNAENSAAKARISQYFEISKIAIVALSLTASVGFLTQAAASVGVTLLCVNGFIWVTGLAVGLLGMAKSFHLAFYGTPEPMPINPLL